MNNKTQIIIGVVIAIAIGTISVDHYANADTNQQIPQWFQDNASLWLSGNISDQQFIQEIHDLISFSSLQNVQTNKTLPVSYTVSHSKTCDDQNFPLVDWHGCDHSNACLNPCNTSHLMAQI